MLNGIISILWGLEIKAMEGIKVRKISSRNENIYYCNFRHRNFICSCSVTDFKE